MGVDEFPSMAPHIVVQNLYEMPRVIATAR
jgi:hypothetical protein